MGTDDGSGSRKRGRGPKTATKTSNPNKSGFGRSTFIPPTLEDTGLNSVTHPTPKLKIKFGGDSNSRIVASSSKNNGEVDTNHNHVSDPDVPNKKVKGRPPKKRGLCELTMSENMSSTAPKSESTESSSAGGAGAGNNGNAPNAMEELKRQSMQFRERMMAQFATEGKSKEKTKKHKKKSKSGKQRDSVGGPNPQVKVIEDGSKRLILRFGKAKGAAPTPPSVVTPDPTPGSENVDSGFTGSSEGSSSSVTESNNNNSSNHHHHPNASSNSGSNLNAGPPIDGPPPIEARGGDEIPPADEAKGEMMPIRLKLSRCFEGYSLQRDEKPVADKNSSCQVR